MLTYEEFKREVIEKLADHLPQPFSGCRIKEERIPKVNGIMEGFVLELPGQEQTIKALPVLYFEHFYDYIRKGVEPERVLALLAETIVKSPAPEMLAETSGQPALRKEDVILQVINRNRNQEYLKELPHRTFLDLAVIYRLMVITEDRQMYSSVINETMRREMKLEEEELFRLARRQMKQRMPYRMFQVCGPLYAYTNDNYCFGAASILEKAGIRRLADRFREDLYILPASIHEIMLLPKGAVSREMARNMLRKANQEGIEPQEWLSDEVYVYRRAEDRIAFAELQN